MRAAIRAAGKPDFRILHFSVQSDHVHLMVEAHDSAALSHGMRGFTIRAARAVNRSLARTGPLWADRYHARPLKTPREVRNGLVYILMNLRKHRSSWSGLDRCSSAPWFDGFRGVRPQETEPPVQRARTWLASVGWRRHGLIDPSELPKAANTWTDAPHGKSQKSVIALRHLAPSCG